MPIQFIKEATHIDFVSQRWPAFIVTGLLFIVTIVSLATVGLNLGIDFKGGIVLEVKAPQAVDTAALRQQMEALKLGDIEIQQFGAPDNVLIRLQRQPGGEEAQTAATTLVRNTLGDSYEYRRVEVVGPRVGDELFNAGIFATIIAMLMIGIYVTVRFEWQFGLAALFATFHDAFVTMGLFSILQLDFNLTAVAAILTLAGYSINDTVVVFDRIRENLRRNKSHDLKQVINDAVNQTLARTIMTAGTTLLALLPLVLFGGPSLLNFSLALTFGIVIGTFSSIYVAAALLLYMKPLKQLSPVPAKA
ncbi:MAG: protein translocase subunit SecF [Bdellovibrionales bacterium]